MNKESNIDIKLTDQTVSKNLRRRRIELGFTQQAISQSIGVSIQQIQKYEKGINRISSGKLNSLATFLKIPVNYFFYQNKDDEIIDHLINDIREKKVISLLKAFKGIKKPQVKDRIIEFVKMISENQV